VVPAVGALGDQADRDARGAQLPPELGIGQRPAQQLRIVLEISQAGIAIVAEQEAQLVRGMAMIDTELGLRPPLADGAEAVLHGDHPVVVALRQAVVAPEIRFDIRHRAFLRHERETEQRVLSLQALVARPGARLLGFPVLWILGIALPLACEHVLPERIVLGILLALVGEHLLPVLGILGVAIAPFLFVVCHCCTLPVVLPCFLHGLLLSRAGEPHASAGGRIVCWSGRCAAVTRAALAPG